MAFLSANSFHGLIKEVTRGTLPGTGTPAYLPVMTPAVTPNQIFLRDSALRGSPVETYDMVQGVRHDELDAKYALYADTFPHLLVALLGSTDTVTGVGPYTHTIGVLNAPATGSQPPSYSLLGFDGANYFTLSGAQAVSGQIAFSSEQSVDGTVKWSANPYVSYTTAPAPFASTSFTTEAMVPGWSVSVSVGGSSFAYISSGEINIERKTAPIFTMGQQGPYVNFAGPITVTGKLTGLVNTNADPWSTGTSGTALVRSPQIVVVTFTDPNDLSGGTDHSVALTMSAVQFEKPKRIVSKEYTEIEVEFEARANATDAISGFAPIKSVTTNGTVAAYN